MSFAQTSSGSIRNKVTRQDRRINIAAEDKWNRNPSWITVPTPTVGEQKVVLLYPVYERPTPAMFHADISSSGTYTIDWGDGTTTLSNSGVFVTKTYNTTSYNHANLADTNAPVTITGATNLISRNNHGYKNNQEITFFDVTGSSNIVEQLPYYVVNATTHTFQVSLERGGTPITIGADGAAALLPYKQAIITITPQAGRQFIGFGQGNASAWQAGFEINLALEMHFSHPTVGANTFRTLDFEGVGGGGGDMIHPLLEYINFVSPFQQNGNYGFVGIGYYIQTLKKIKAASGTTFTNGWYPNIGSHALREVEAELRFFVNFSLRSRMLQKVVLDGTGYPGNTLESAFRECYNLQEVTLLNLPSTITNMGGMFANCFNLKKVNTMNTAGVTNVTAMFENCYNLEEAPMLNLPAVNTLTRMFNNCFNLTTVENITIGNVPSTMQEMFRACFSLKNVGLFNTSAVTNATDMFLDCTALKKVPSLSFNALTNATQMFRACYSLIEAPLKNVNSLTTADSMFRYCTSFQHPPIIKSALVSASNMFAEGPTLKSCVHYNLDNATNIQNMYNSTRSLIQKTPSYNLNTVTVALDAAFNGAQGFHTMNAFNIKRNLNLGVGDWISSYLTRDDIQDIMDTKLASGTFRWYVDPYSGINSQPVLTLSGRWSSNSGISTLNKTCTTTAGSNTVTTSSTTGWSVGNYILGNNVTSSVSATLDATTNTVNRVAHGLSNGTPVSFNMFTKTVTTQGADNTLTFANHGLSNLNLVRIVSVTTTTGLQTGWNYYVRNATTNTFQLSLQTTGSLIDLVNDGTAVINYQPEVAPLLFRPYYVINATADSFQISNTVDGSPIDIPVDCSVTIIYAVTITGITSNSLTISAPASASGTVTLTAGSTLNRSIALLKGFTVSG